MPAASEIPVLAKSAEPQSGRRILIVAMNYAPEIAGCGKYTGEAGAAFAARGHDVEIITTPPHYPGWRVVRPLGNRYARQTIDGVEIWRCPLVLRRPMNGIWRLVAPLSFALTAAPVIVLRCLTRRPGTIVMIEPTLLAAPIALLMGKLTGARTILHVQDLEVDAAFAVGHLASNAWLRRWAAWFERRCVRAFDQVVTISYAMAARLAEKGVAPSRISVVRNWVDLEHIRPTETSAAYRKELGLPADAFVVLYSGSLGSKQGLHVLVDAARLLADRPDIVLVIAGEGPAAAELRALAAGLENVRFLPFQPYERLGEFLTLCDLHVLPQLASAGDLVLPSKLGGMLASGRPILATAEPGTELAQFIAGAASIVAPEDANPLAEAILSIASGQVLDGREARLALAAQLSHREAFERLEGLLFAPLPVVEETAA